MIRRPKRHPINTHFVAGIDTIEMLIESDPFHTTCCRPTQALCGMTLPADRPDNLAPADDEPPIEEQCVRCLWHQHARHTCGARFCRLRQWWRNLLAAAERAGDG